MTSAVIIQARMSSTRLPGKVLMELAGRTVLAHVLERTRAIEGIDVVVCAIPDTPVDDVLVPEIERAGAVVVRGSQDDVLARYHKAAVAVGADTVMRVTSDCPLIDPAVCAQLLALHRREQADFGALNLGSATWPHGLECETIAFSWLDRAYREAARKLEREHVSPFIRHHAEARKVNLDGPGGAAVEHHWTIDTPRDLDFLTALFRRLPTGPERFDWHTAFAIGESDAQLMALNSGQVRDEGMLRSLKEEQAALKTKRS